MPVNANLIHSKSLCDVAIIVVQVDTMLIDLSDCTKEDDQIQSLTKIAKRSVVLCEILD